MKSLICILPAFIISCGIVVEKNFPEDPIGRCDTSKFSLSCAAPPRPLPGPEKECREVQEKNQHKITIANGKAEGLREQNQKALADAKSRYSIVDESQVAILALHTQLKFKTLAWEDMTLQAFSSSKGGLNLYETYRIDAESSQLRADDPEAQKMLKFKYAVFLGIEVGSICDGPQEMRRVGTLGQSAFMATNPDGSLEYVKFDPEFEVLQTLQTCFVDDGARCAAVAIPSAKFYLTNSQDSFIKEKTDSYKESVIEIKTEIIRNY